MNKCGIMVSEIPFSNMPVLLKNSGLDYFILDCEHGGFDYCDISRMIMTARLCNLPIIVRLPNNDRKDIIKFMDMGADGVLLPMTNTVDDIKKVVEYAKYQPQFLFYFPYREYHIKCSFSNLKRKSALRTSAGLRIICFVKIYIFLLF